MKAVELNNVTVKRGKFKALDNMNFEIDEGSFASIVGPNGAGKTTLLKLILGLIKPEVGEVKVFGKNPTKVPAGSLGYVPQIKTFDRSFPALPVELVASGLKAEWTAKIDKKIKEDICEALERAGAAEIANRPLNKLSGGELQRVFLARSLVRKPKLMLLDEPAAGIDATGENDMHKILDDYQSETGAAIAMVTHDWEAAYHHSDMVMLLDRRMICYCSPEKAFSEDYLRETFSHIGHRHEIMFGAKK